jgi:hypothetical protein
MSRQPEDDERSHVEVGSPVNCHEPAPGSLYFCSRPIDHFGRHVAYAVHNSALGSARRAEAGECIDAWGYAGSEIGLDTLRSELLEVFNATY